MSTERGFCVSRRRPNKIITFHECWCDFLYVFQTLTCIACIYVVDVVFHVCVYNVVIFPRVIFWFWSLRGFSGCTCGRLGHYFGSTWAPSGHFGGATGQGKSTDDDTWCATVMGLLDLLIFYWLYKVLWRGCESWQENRWSNTVCCGHGFGGIVDTSLVL